MVAVLREVSLTGLKEPGDSYESIPQSRHRNSRRKKYAGIADGAFALEVPGG